MNSERTNWFCISVVRFVVSQNARKLVAGTLHFEHMPLMNLILCRQSMHPTWFHKLNTNELLSLWWCKMLNDKTNERQSAPFCARRFRMFAHSIWPSNDFWRIFMCIFLVVIRLRLLSERKCWPTSLRFVKCLDRPWYFANENFLYEMSLALCQLMVNRGERVNERESFIKIKTSERKSTN